MDASKQLFNLIDLIYGMATDRGQLPAFLKGLVSQFEADVATLFLYDKKSKDVYTEVNVYGDPDFMKSYKEHYVHVDTGFQKVLKKPIQTTHTLEMLLSDREYLNGEMYNGFMRPRNLRHSIGGIVFKEESRQSCLVVNRVEGKNPFTEDDVAAFDLLMPHLGRAFQLRRQFSHLKGRGDAAVEALNWLPMGVALLDGQGKVVLMNRAAEEILRTMDGLSVSGGKFRAGKRDENSALLGLVHRASATGNGNGLHPGGALTISRPSDLRPFEVLVAPLRAKAMGWIHLGASAVVFISDPEREHELPEGLAARLYGLTPAEERLLGDLLRGQSLNEVSEFRNVSQNTLRWQLKNVFRKTETKRQSELVKLVLAGPALLRMPFDNSAPPFKSLDS